MSGKMMQYLIVAVLVIVACAAGGYYVYNQATAEPTEYNITYVLDGGVNSNSNASTYTVGQTCGLDYPTKEGYLFGGWYSDKDLTVSMDVIKANHKGDVVVYAKWIETIGSGYHMDVTGKNEDLKDSEGSYDLTGTRTLTYVGQTSDGSLLIKYSDIIVHKSIRGNSTETAEGNNQESVKDTDIDSKETFGREVLDDRYCDHVKYTMKDGSTREVWYCYGWLIYKVIYTKADSDNDVEKTYKFRDYYSVQIKDSYTVKAYAEDGLTTLGSGSYSKGSSVTVSVEADEGSEFGGWYDLDGNKVSESASYTVLGLCSDITLVAHNNNSSATITLYDFGKVLLPIDGRYMSAEWNIVSLGTGETAKLSGLRQEFEFTAGGEYRIYICGTDNDEKMICDCYSVFVDKFKLTILTDDYLSVYCNDEAVTGPFYHSSSDTMKLTVRSIFVGFQFDGWYTTDGELCEVSTSFTVEELSADQIYCAALVSERSFDDPKDFELPEYEGVTVSKRIISNDCGERSIVITTESYEPDCMGTYLVSTFGKDESGNDVYRCCLIEVGGDIVRHHTWTCNGKEYSCDIHIEYIVYEYYLNLETNSRSYVKNDNNVHNKSFITYQDPKITYEGKSYTGKNTIALLAKDLKDMAEKESMDKTQTAYLVLTFVQSIEYQDDKSRFGVTEYWTYPYETMYDMVGDYSDKVFVFISLMKSLGYDMSMLVFNNHMSSAWISDTNIYCESASEGYGLDEIPTGIDYIGRAYNRSSSNYCQFISID